ncbi:hypothetical protein CMUS01_03209 [Colletotrichum musicola]|uniref:Uncharacterized protein n=1 Tax=Colletotrichum musicola TaxID=2175873 RepID=A0A8H6NTL1_9PEZI|nr:hypothetical protein CMUS01_03209 [Colletotrichum musicola]
MSTNNKPPSTTPRKRVVYLASSTSVSKEFALSQLACLATKRLLNLARSQSLSATEKQSQKASTSQAEFRRMDPSSASDDQCTAAAAGHVLAAQPPMANRSCGLVRGTRDSRQPCTLTPGPFPTVQGCGGLNQHSSVAFSVAVGEARASATKKLQTARTEDLVDDGAPRPVSVRKSLWKWSLMPTAVWTEVTADPMTPIVIN